MLLTRRTIAVRLGFFFTNIDNISTLLTPLFLQSNPTFMIYMLYLHGLRGLKYHLYRRG